MRADNFCHCAAQEAKARAPYITACIKSVCHANGSNSDTGHSCLGSLGNTPTNWIDYICCCAAQRAKARRATVTITAYINTVCHVNDSNSDRGCSCLSSLDHTPTQKTDKFCGCAAKKAKARAATVTITAYINSVCHVNDSNSDRGWSCLGSLNNTLTNFWCAAQRAKLRASLCPSRLCPYFQTLPMQMSLYVG
jgi:hypothetical protein